MHSFIKYLAGAAAIGGLAAPAAAQYYPQPYPQPQPYVQPYAQPYAQPYQGYGYQQGYAQNPVQQIIDGLLGNRYNVTDRQAVSTCASAVLAQAQSQYRTMDPRYGYQNSYQNGYAYNRQIAAPAMRVTAITNVERRSNGLRVRGTLSSGYAANGYQPGYNQQAYAAGDLSFRCNVDYRGAVTGIRITPTNNRYRRY